MRDAQLWRELGLRLARDTPHCMLLLLTSAWLREEVENSQPEARDNRLRTTGRLLLRLGGSTTEAASA
jgi:hypothetical protein